MNLSADKDPVILSKNAARRALARVRLIGAGFEISNLTHTIGEMMSGAGVEARLDAWHFEGDCFMKLLLSMKVQGAAYNAMTDIQAFHKLAFQYGRRMYFN